MGTDRAAVHRSADTVQNLEKPGYISPVKNHGVLGTFPYSYIEAVRNHFGHEIIHHKCP